MGYLFWAEGLSRALPSGLNKIQNLCYDHHQLLYNNVPFGVTYEKIGTIQRRLAWPLHKDDTLSRSGRSTDLNIYFPFLLSEYIRDVQHLLLSFSH